MRVEQGKAAARELARALSLIDGLIVYWYPAAFTDIRGFTGILYVNQVELSPAFNAKQASPQNITWTLEIIGPTDAMSSGEVTEAKYMNLLCTDVREDKPVSIYDAVRNWAKKAPTGWQPHWQPFNAFVTQANLFRREETEAETVMRVVIEAVM